MNHIDKYLTTLEKTFGKPRQKMKTMMLEIEFNTDNIAEMVRIIARTIFERGMPCIQVGRVKNGGSKRAIAWLKLLEPVPPYGTDAFRRTQVQLCIRNSLIAEAPFQTVAFAIAHELAHLILYSIGQTQHDEKYVDLIAMHFGFAELYVQGKKFSVRQSSQSRRVGFDGSIESMLQLSTVLRVGYLSESETRYACKMIALRR